MTFSSLTTGSSSQGRLSHVDAVAVDTDASSQPSKSSRFLMPLLVCAAGGLCLWKLARLTFVRVSPNSVTVVYETRRKTVLTTSMDSERSANDYYFPQSSHSRPWLYLCGLLLYSSPTMVIVPPSSFYSTFTIPRDVVGAGSGDGAAMDCSVGGVHTSDGVVNLSLTIRYVIPLAQVERYLVAVGPIPPNEAIGVAVGTVLKSHCAQLSVGILLNKSRRELTFVQPVTAHLACKLQSEYAIRLIRIDVESIELCEEDD